MTLIELLVVMSIIVVLAVVTIPALRPAMEGRRIREAARAVEVFISSAQNRAAEGGTKFGVEFERDPNLALGCRTLYQLEMPDPYSGQMANSVIDLTVSGTPPAYVTGPGVATATVYFYYMFGGAAVGEDPFTLGFIRAGDEFTFNNRPEKWTITSITPSGIDSYHWIFQFYVPAGLTFPTPPASPPVLSWTGVPYKVNRQPVRSNIPPLQLPRSVVIDFSYSGLQTAMSGPAVPYPPYQYQYSFWPYNNSDLRSLVIIFNSRRSVDRFYATETSSGAGYYMAYRPIGPIFLLVGRRDRVNPDADPASRLTYDYTAAIGDFYNPSGGATVVQEPAPVAEDGLSNFRDLGNLWLSINTQSGLVSCSEIYQDNFQNQVFNSTGSAVFDTSGKYQLYNFMTSREFARQFQSMGGR